jgi:diphthine synthase
MLYIIGLGLDKKGISQQGLEAVRRCKKIYLENYTVDFPYTSHELEEVIGKDVVSVGRDFVEGLEFVDEAAKKDVALLVYGSPLTATTHITVVDECKASGVKCKVIYAASVFDAVAETGLQLYKFGKVASMPAWKFNYSPDSFMEIVKDNQGVKAHSLILIDIGLDITAALSQLKKACANHKIKLKKIILCQALGTSKSKIFYKTLKELEDFTSVRKPYCLIIPGDLHFVEAEVLKGFE